MWRRSLLERGSDVILFKFLIMFMRVWCDAAVIYEAFLLLFAEISMHATLRIKSQSCE